MPDQPTEYIPPWRLPTEGSETQEPEVSTQPATPVKSKQKYLKYIIALLLIVLTLLAFVLIRALFFKPTIPVPLPSMFFGDLEFIHQQEDDKPRPGCKFKKSADPIEPINLEINSTILTIETKTWNTYEDSKLLGLQFKYPPNWGLDERRKTTSTTIPSVTLNLTHKSGDVTTLRIEDETKQKIGRDARSYFNKAKFAYFTEVYCDGKVKLGDLTGYGGVGPKILGGFGKALLKLVFLEKGDRLVGFYLSEWSPKGPNSIKSEKELNLLLNTFYFIE